MVAASVGLTAGLAPASATPAQSPGVNLWVFEDPANRANYGVTVELNEDSDGADEVFVEARFLDVDQGVHTAFTNVVTGEF